MEIADYVGPLGVGLLCGGFAAIIGRRKRSKLAASGDEKAKAELKKWRIADTVVAPILIVAGVCLLALQFYLDYQKAQSPLPPDKALDDALKRLPKSN